MRSEPYVLRREFLKVQILMITKHPHPHVSIKGISDAPHETDQAIRFGQLQGGGEFEFLGNYSQGIEGYFIPDGLTTKIPVSLKEFNTTSVKNVFRRIRKNAKQVLAAGFDGLTFLYVSLPQFTTEDILNYCANSKPNVMPPVGIFQQITFDCLDGVVLINVKGETSRKP